MTPIALINAAATMSPITAGLRFESDAVDWSAWRRRVSGMASPFVAASTSIRADGSPRCGMRPVGESTNVSFWSAFFETFGVLGSVRCRRCKVRALSSVSATVGA